MRYGSLDSLRGLAAMVVVFHHLRLVLQDEPSALIKNTPLRLLFSGESAVIVFFVLSGFVLHLSLTSGGPKPVWAYALRRFLRIYLPFCIAILVSALLWHLIEPTSLPSVMPWINLYSWQVRPDMQVILAHLFMTDARAMQSLDNVMWSLVVELRLSLLFPIIATGLLWNWRATCALSIACSLGCAYLDRFSSPEWVVNPFLTGKYLALFAIGGAMAENVARLQVVIGGMRPLLRTLLWCLALVLFSFYPTRAFGVPTTLGATVLVALTLSDARVQPVLLSRMPLWLGRVSYSLYLIHLPVMLALLHILQGAVPPPLVLPLAGISSLGAAEVMFRAVELPSIRMGRRLLTPPHLLARASHAE